MNSEITSNSLIYFFFNFEETDDTMIKIRIGVFCFGKWSICRLLVESESVTDVNISVKYLFRLKISIKELYLFSHLEYFNREEIHKYYLFFRKLAW